MGRLLQSFEIPVNSYLEYALSLNSMEVNLLENFGQWLPATIIDSHAHSNTQAQCEFISESCFRRVCSTFPWFEVKQHIKVINTLYPQKYFRMLLSPVPYIGINHREANDYLLQETAGNPLVVPICYGIPDDIGYTLSQLKSGKFHGLKMYPAYFYPPAKRIYEYYPKETLTFCQEMELPIILHLPCPLIDCKEELITIAKNFPHLKIVVAHMGLMYLPTANLADSFSLIGKQENIYLDTAMITSSAVLKMALNIFGAERILFGTDQPLNLIRGKFYRHPQKGTRILTEYGYHWAVPQEQEEFSLQAKNAVLIHWGILSALREAVDLCTNSENVKDNIFNRNAKWVFKIY